MGLPHPHLAVALWLLASAGVENCSSGNADGPRPPLSCLAHPDLLGLLANPLSLKPGAGWKLLVNVIVNLGAGTYALGR